MGMMEHPGDNRIAAFPRDPGSGVCPTALTKHKPQPASTSAS